MRLKTFAYLMRKKLIDLDIESAVNLNCNWFVCEPACFSDVISGERAGLVFANWSGGREEIGNCA